MIDRKAVISIKYFGKMWIARNESKFYTEHTNKECNKCHLNSNVEKICSRPALNFKKYI